MLILVLGFAFERKGRERERKREREERKKRLEFGSLAREIKWVGSWTDGSRSERSERKEIKRLFDLNLPLFDFKKKKKTHAQSEYTRLKIYTGQNSVQSTLFSVNPFESEILKSQSFSRVSVYTYLLQMDTALWGVGEWEKGEGMANRLLISPRSTRDSTIVFSLSTLNSSMQK